MPSNRSRAFPGTLRLAPRADLAPGLIQAARGVFVPAVVQAPQVARQPDQEPELLQPEVGAGERIPAPLGVRGFDQPFQHVEGRSLHAVAQEKLLAARKTLDRRHQPRHEAIVGVQRRPGAAGMVRSGRSTPGRRLIRRQRSALLSFGSPRQFRTKGGKPPLEPPERKAVKIQGVKLRATRTPTWSRRSPVVRQERFADRRKPRSAAPGAPAPHAATTVSLLPRAAIRRCPHITVVPTVLHPFPRVPVYVVQPEPVRPERPHRRCLLPVPSTPTSLQFARFRPISFPQLYFRVPLPARATYSHSASLNSRYAFPVFSLSHITYVCTWFQLTLITGRFPRPHPSSSGRCP